MQMIGNFVSLEKIFIDIFVAQADSSFFASWRGKESPGSIEQRTSE